MPCAALKSYLTNKEAAIGKSYCHYVSLRWNLGYIFWSSMAPLKNDDNNITYLYSEA